jgi:large subunit ribosomal protein L17
MRHRVRSRKLGRTQAHRKAMYRNMVTSLLEHERIQTTDAKAKEVRRIAEQMITLGKRGGLHARRQALRVIRDRSVAAKVFDDLAERYRERPGGYTRVLKLRVRPGDAAALSLVELVDSGASAASTEKPAAKKKAAKKAPKKEKSADSSDEKPAAKKKSTSKKAASKADSKKTTKKAAAKKSTAKKTPAKKKTRKSSK